MQFSRWLDGVHLLGIAAGVLGVGAIALGLTILLGLGPRGVGYDAAPRRARRAWHIAFGAAAVGLGLAHVVGRALQIGTLSLNPQGPAPLAFAALLLGISGLLRAVIPWRFSGVVAVFAWLHRLGVLAGVVLLARHVHYQAGRFLGGGAPL